MNRSVSLLACALIAGVALVGAAQAQPGPQGGGRHAQGHAGDGRQQGREQRREEFREQRPRPPAPVAPPVSAPVRDAGASDSRTGGDRMSPEERRQLRHQIREYGRENYRDRK